MKEILELAPVWIIIISPIIIAIFCFAVVMQPIFVWMICARLKRTNQLLAALAANSKLPPRKPLF